MQDMARSQEEEEEDDEGQQEEQCDPALMRQNRSSFKSNLRSVHSSSDRLNNHFSPPLIHLQKQLCTFIPVITITITEQPQTALILLNI